MPHTATIVSLPAMATAIEPAIVMGNCDPHGNIRVCRPGGSIDRDARLAVLPRPELEPGDEVLTMTDGSGRAYIVGVLSCKTGNTSRSEQIRLANGAYARVDRSLADESLKLYSKENELLIDYHSPTGTVKVNVASGNLEFTATNGSIVFHSAKDIHMDGDHVAVNARNDIHMGVRDPNGGAGPVIAMNARKLQLASPVMELIAQRAQLFLQETRIAGKQLIGRFGNIQSISRKFESVADTVMTKAKNVYRTVSELSQLKAGRQRTLIEKTSHMKAQKTIMKSEQDFKIKAEKIHLG
ncbi:DUF3540 domain-containing protein [Desulfosarcina sp.]|uniref:DUF3540 domain-containing protein n=1 Tax=Desulfosarcina sp. TaxID=2027861 RepID=UPI0039707CDD